MPRQFAWVVLGLFLTLTSAATANLVIYDDQSENGFNDGCSFGGIASDFDVANTTTVHSGTYSIRFTPDTFNAVSWCAPATYSAATDYTGIDFWVNGGTTGGQDVDVVLGLGNSSVKFASLTSLNAGNPIPASFWQHIQASFTSGDLAYSGDFDRISLQDESGGTQANIYFDDVMLVGPTSQQATQNSIFADSFEPELLFVPQYATNSIKVYQHVTNPAPGTPDFTLLHTAPLAVGIKPNALAFSPDGNLWVVDDGAESLLRYTQQAILNDANPIPDIVIGPVGNGNSIIGMAFFGAYAYVAQTDFGATNRVLKFAVADLAAGNNVSTALTNANLATPAGLAFDAQGRLWITNNGNNTVVRMSNTSTGAVDKIGTNTSVGARNSLNNIEGVAFDQYGSLWVGNNGEPTISAYADWQLNDAAFGATVPVYQLDIAPGVTVPAMGHTGFVGGLAFDRNGNQWSNYEDTYSVLEYALTSFPRGGGMPGVGSYTSTPEPILGNNDVTTDPGFGGIAFWPVPNTLHVR
jgi:sugar lactone lactonase YvrE